ncbi:MAG: Hsp33 family molecular chaperone HslO [Pseudomonadota bacterium]
MTPSRADGQTSVDHLLAFTVPERNARGRIMRVGPELDAILSAHEYPAFVKHLLAEALVLTALMGALLKDADGQLTMQAQTSTGAIELLVCDYRGGELRGYVRHDADRLAELGANPTLSALFGEGYLAITFDLAATGQRYQGIVPLEGASLAEACEKYFTQSEQVPTLLRVAVRSNGQHCVGGGLLVQHLPEGEEGRERLHARFDHPEWEHVATMANSVRHDELVDPALALDEVIWRLFHEESEVRINAPSTLRKGCRCNAEHYRAVLSRFPEAERLEMRDKEGAIVVDCAFCSRLFRVEV